MNIIEKVLKFKRKTRPSLLMIEPTNKCNLNCPFCLTNIDENYKNSSHSSMKRELGFMSMDLFDKILKDAKEFEIKNIFLEFWGESFLHPNISTMITSIAKYNYNLSIFTNGVMIKDEHMDVIKDRVNTITFSIDAASDAIYRKSRIGGHYEKVWENMLKLNNICKDSRTEVRWQFIVMSTNEHEIEKAIDLSKQNNISLILKTYNPALSDRIPSKKNYIRKAKIKPCTSIYKQFAVLWNGDVVPCCQDPDGRCILGNVNSDTLVDIWNGQKYEKFREKVQRAKNDPGNEPNICKTCTSWQS